MRTGRVGWEALVVVLVVLLAACDPAPPAPVDGSGPGIDAGRDDDASADDAAACACESDADCDDGSYCNGLETCADCACEPAVSRPCEPDETCDESADACRSDCPDEDGDGETDGACGGADCDDADPNRFPGNAEVCDVRHDEDCDPATLGTRDGDSDGYVSAACCNAIAGSPPACGPDCDDADPGSHPTEAESCDGVDNDCDGAVDEGAMLTFYRDVDGDGYGVTSTTRSGCSATTGYVPVAGDCDDARGTTHPGAVDLCNGFDDDCDGNADCDASSGTCCACTMGTSRDCGTPDGSGGFLETGACQHGTQDCITGTWGTCVGAVPPMAETCNGVDDDCDGAIDDAVGAAYFRDCDGDGYGASGTPSMSGCMPPAAPPTCGAGTGVWVANGDDCNDATTAIRPGVPEPCDGVDNDCDGVVDGADSAPFCNPTSLPNTMTAACSAATCVVETCRTTHLDCTGAAGCETSNTDPLNCGSCGNDCPWNVCRPERTCDRPVALDLGGSHGCSLWESGAIYCWGDDSSQQLANGGGGSTDRMTVAAMGIGSGAVEVATGALQSCVRYASGAVSCWGALLSGIAPVAGLTDAVDVGVGGVRGAATHTLACAVRTGGSVVCWGNNNNSGQLGTGTRTASSTPVAVVGLADAVEVAVGETHVCARRAGGSVVCWGEDESGQLGDGSAPHPGSDCGGVSCSLIPVAVAGITDAVQLAVGEECSCARHATGAVSCWGSPNCLGDGRGPSGSDRATPGPVTGLTDATWIDAGQDHVCARRTTGAVACWGDNRDGQLGNGTVTGGATPGPVMMLADALDVVASGRTSCARRASGDAVCWGSDLRGIVGDGPPAVSANTVPVTMLPPP